MLAFHERLLSGLRTLPGAAAAGAIEPLPILGGERTLSLGVPGQQAARSEIRHADPDLAVLALATVEQLRLEDRSSDEVISGMQEIGIRMALGASGTGVLAMILAQGTRLGLGGVAIGLALGFAMARAMPSLLYGVSPTDPGTYGAVAGLMLAIALVASAVPAWRATRVDPIRTLRTE